MKGNSYKLTSSTLSIISHADGKRIPFQLPPNTIITLMDDALDGEDLTRVMWEDKLLLMFKQDIRTRGQEVQR